ncbi:MAG: phospholipid carrier-dependent glycosyltransferase [Phycisphaeraceae bacterium]
MSANPDKLTATTPASAPAAESAGRPARRTTGPPRQREWLTGWMALLVCLALAAVPLLIDLGRGDAIVPAEARAVARSAETWRGQVRLDHESWREAAVPWYDGEPQLEAPPGTTWMHLAAFDLLDVPPGDPGGQLLAARLVAAAGALLTVAAVFWAGLSIGGLTTASLAALVCLASPVLLMFGRLGSGDAPLLALTALSLAAAVWAIRPLKAAASRWRQAVGWILAGVLLGLAVLTGGIVAGVAVLMSLLLILVLCPHRLSHVLGLVAAALIAALVCTPWVLEVHGRDPAIWQSWLADLVLPAGQAPAEAGEVFGRRLGLLLAVMLPWTPWLIAAMMQPFSTSSTGSRLRMFLGWVWFVPLAMLLLMVPGEGTIREVLLAVPAGSLLIGQVFRQYVDLSAEGRHARMWRLLSWPCVGLLLLVSIALPMSLHYQARLVEKGWIEAPPVAAMHPTYWVSCGLLLVLLVLLSMRFVGRHFPGKAVMVWALWVVTAAAMLTVPVARGPWLHSTTPRDTRLLSRLRQDVAIYRLSDPLPPGVMLYLGSPVPRLTRQRLVAGDAAGRWYLLLQDGQPMPPTMREVIRLPDSELRLARPVVDGSR